MHLHIDYLVERLIKLLTPFFLLITPSPYTHFSRQHSAIANKPRSEMTEEELRQQEEVEFNTGPLSVLQQFVKNNNQILISCRNNHKLFARVKAFDCHCNMVLENVKEMWTETPRSGKGAKAKPVNKDCFVSKMFLRGDTVVLVVRNTA
ncbi:unnamed protein product [Mucor hiemalis]